MLFSVPETEIDIRERSPIALAFLGDSVLELMVRAKLLALSRRTPAYLHRESIEIVSAKGQAAYLAKLLPLLTEEEQGVVRRGRNANKSSVSKHATAKEYSASTALESLFGWLYLQKQFARLDELFEAIWHEHLVRQKNKINELSEKGELV